MCLSVPECGAEMMYTSGRTFACLVNISELETLRDAHFCTMNCNFVSSFRGFELKFLTDGSDTKSETEIFMVSITLLFAFWHQFYFHFSFCQS